jgi:hypothetical protein
MKGLRHNNIVTLRYYFLLFFPSRHQKVRFANDFHGTSDGQKRWRERINFIIYYKPIIVDSSDFIEIK